MIEKMKKNALSDNQLDNVAGGTYLDSMQVTQFLTKAGYKGMTDEKFGLAVNFDNMRKAVDSLGFESHDHGGMSNDNTYTEKATGKVFTQDEFMSFLHKKFPDVK